MKTKLLPIPKIEPLKVEFKKVYIAVFFEARIGDSFSVEYKKSPTSKQLQTAIKNSDENYEVIAIIEVEK